jgi:hypothetical protein
VRFRNDTGIGVIRPVFVRGIGIRDVPGTGGAAEYDDEEEEDEDVENGALVDMTTQEENQDANIARVCGPTWLKGSGGVGAGTTSLLGQVTGIIGYERSVFRCRLDETFRQRSGASVAYFATWQAECVRSVVVVSIVVQDDVAARNNDAPPISVLGRQRAVRADKGSDGSDGCLIHVTVKGDKVSSRLMVLTGLLHAQAKLNCGSVFITNSRQRTNYRQAGV